MEEEKAYLNNLKDYLEKVVEKEDMSLFASQSMCMLEYLLYWLAENGKVAEMIVKKDEKLLRIMQNMIAFKESFNKGEIIKLNLRN